MVSSFRVPVRILALPRTKPTASSRFLPEISASCPTAYVRQRHLYARQPTDKWVSWDKNPLQKEVSQWYPACAWQRPLAPAILGRCRSQDAAGRSGVLPPQARRRARPFAGDERMALQDQIALGIALPEGVAKMLMPYQTSCPNSYRLMKSPITRSWMRSVFEKQIVRRTNRLIRVRRLMCLLSIFCVLALPA